MLSKLTSFFKKPMTPNDYISPETRLLVGLESLDLMRRNQDHDVIMHLVFGESNLKSVATKLGVEKHEVMHVITPEQARIVAYLEMAAAVMAASGLNGNDLVRRRKLRQLYKKHVRFIK